MTNMQKQIEALMNASDKGIVEDVQVFLEGGGAFQGIIKRGEHGLYEMISMAQVQNPTTRQVEMQAFQVFIDPGSILGFMVPFGESVPSPIAVPPGAGQLYTGRS